jgi:hypothetical protein
MPQQPHHSLHPIKTSCIGGAFGLLLVVFFGVSLFGAPLWAYVAALSGGITFGVSIRIIELLGRRVLSSFLAVFAMGGGVLVVAYLQRDVPDIPWNGVVWWLATSMTVIVLQTRRIHHLLIGWLGNEPPVR